jgi:C4-dicarboxylate-binding protein DctP
MIMKLKKVLFLALCMVVALFALTACGGEEATTEEGTEATGDGTYTIRIAHTEAEDRSLNLACEEFGKWISEQTDGAVTVEVYPNGSFSGSDSDILQATALGQLEIGLPAAQAFTEYNPVWGILDMPFLFESADAYFNAMDGELGNALTETLEGTEFTMLGYAFMGVKQITNSVRPVHTVEDLAGLKMRTQQSDAHIAMYEAMGANPTPMSFGEVFTALQQGTVDGQDQTGTIIWAQKWYEAQKYMTITNHNYGTMCFVANTEWLNSLPEDIRALIEEGTKTYLIDWQRQYELDAEAECQKNIADAGLEVYTPTEEELQTFIDACAPVNEKYAQEWGQEWFDMAKAANEAVAAGTTEE